MHAPCSCEPEVTAGGRERLGPLLRRRGGWPSGLSLLPAAAVALAPKCPLCWLGYASLAGLTGLGRVGSFLAAWAAPLTLVTLVLALAAIALPAPHRRGAIVLALLAAAVVAAGSLGLGPPPLTVGGLALLAAAYVWSRWPRAIQSTKGEMP